MLNGTWMVQSRGRRRGSSKTNTLVFVAASVMGGLGTGVMIGIGSALVPERLQLPHEIGLVVLVIASFVAILRDSGRLRIRLPEPRRQVRFSVWEERPVVGAAVFGFELGTGFRTFITGSAPYVLVIVLMLVRWPILVPLLVGAGFGLGRGVFAVGRLLLRDPNVWDRRMESARPVLPYAGVGILFIVVGVAQMQTGVAI